MGIKGLLRYHQLGTLVPCIINDVVLKPVTLGLGTTFTTRSDRGLLRGRPKTNKVVHFVPVVGTSVPVDLTF